MTIEAMKDKETSSKSMREFFLIDAIEQYGKAILCAMAMGMGLLFILAYYYAGREAKLESDYLAVENQFMQLQRSLNASPREQAAIERSFGELSALLLQYPTLQARYDPVVAQQLLASQLPELAHPLLERSWKRVAKSEAFPLIPFAQVTYQIAQGEWQTALTTNRQLVEELGGAEQVAHFSLMEEYNHIRQALLAAAIDPNSEATSSLWRQLNDTLALHSDRAVEGAAHSDLIQLLGDGQISFPDYLRHQMQSVQ